MDTRTVWAEASFLQKEARGICSSQNVNSYYRTHVDSLIKHQNTILTKLKNFVVRIRCSYF